MMQHSAKVQKDLACMKASKTNTDPHAQFTIEDVKDIVENYFKGKF